MWAGRGNRHNCREWGGIHGSACSIKVAAGDRAAKEAASESTASGEVSPVSTRSSFRATGPGRIKQTGEEVKGRSRPMDRRCRIALSTKDRAPHVVVAAHNRARHSSEKRWRRVGTSVVVFIVLHFPFFFLFENHHSHPLKSGLYSCVFLLIYSHRQEKTINSALLEAWAHRGDTKMTFKFCCIWVGAFCPFLGTTAVFLFDFPTVSPQCTRETQRAAVGILFVSF